MTNFSFLKANTEFQELATFCEDAETFAVSHPNLSAISARNALEFVIKYIYKAKTGVMPPRISLFELIDSYEISNFIDDQVIKDSLHFIRILGNNAAHNNKITQSQALLCIENLHFFIGEVMILLEVVDDYPEFDRALLTKATEPKPIEPKPTIEVKGEAEETFKKGVDKGTKFQAKRPEYMTEARTRKIYIDLYLQESGWEVLEKEDVAVPCKAGIEIRVEGMPNASEEGYCDYVLYGRNGLPLAVVEAKKTSVQKRNGLKIRQQANEERIFSFERERR